MKILLLSLLLLLSPAFCGGEESSSFSNEFISYIQVCENGIQKGWNKDQQKWLPYWDGGNWNIAYGHLIEEGQFSNGITHEEAMDLLLNDLTTAYKKAERYWSKRGKDFNSFPEKSKEIVIDFTFNGCLYSHPKFMNAVANADLERQCKEYKRYAVLNGKRVELKDRNTRFFNRYLSLAD